MGNIEATVRSHEICLTEFDTSLAGLQRRLAMANSHNQEMQTAYSSAANIYNLAKDQYDDCWFLCGDLEEAMDFAWTALFTARTRATNAAKDASNLAQETVNLGKEVQHYRNELNLKKMD